MTVPLFTGLEDLESGPVFNIYVRGPVIALKFRISCL